MAKPRASSTKRQRENSKKEKQRIKAEKKADRKTVAGEKQESGPPILPLDYE